jgi:hypothetical protein
MQSLQSRAFGASFAAFEASVAAAVTIAARAPIIAGHVAGTRSGRPDESLRMVTEKMEAAAEGVMAAQMAMWSLWVQMAFGGVRGPTALAHGFVDIAEAAIRPAHRRVRANAKRLSGR